MPAVSISVDLQEFADLIPRLVKASGKTLSQIVRQQARLMLRGSGEGRDEGLIPYTPPPKGQDQGKAAVARDINRVFLTTTKARKIVKGSGVRGLTAAFSRAIKQQQYSKALDILKGQTTETFQVSGYTTTRRGKTVTVKPYTLTRRASVLGNNALLSLNNHNSTPVKQVHQQRRSRSTGTVRKDGYSMLITRPGSLADYIKRVQKKVGIMKAGWRKAAQALDVTLPTFVKNAPRGSGDVRIDLENESDPSVTMTNNTPGIRRSMDSIMDRTLRGRRLRMAKDIENKLEAALKKEQAK